MFFDAAGFIVSQEGRGAVELPAVAEAGKVVTLSSGTLKQISLSTLGDIGSSGIAVNFDAGYLRVNFMEPQRLHLEDFVYNASLDKYSLLEKAPVNIPYAAQLLPTYSDFSERYAVIQRPVEDGNHLSEPTSEGHWEIGLGSRLTDEKPASLSRLSIGSEAPKGDYSAQFGPPSYAGALAFSNRDEAIVVRESKEKFKVVSLDSNATSQTLVVPEKLRELQPVRQPWRLTRPLLAAVRAISPSVGSPTWRLAWLAPEGVATAEAIEGTTQLYQLQDTLFAAIPRMDYAMKLTFDNDGKRLFLVAQPEPGVVEVRAFDLSDERRDRIDRASRKQLLSEACSILSQIDPAELLNAQPSMGAWSSIGPLKPCQGG